MKKVIVMVSILFICAIGVLGYYFFDAKKNQDTDVYELNKRIVDIVDSKAQDDIHINDVVISNIKIVDNKEVKFNITATKTDLSSKTLHIMLYNDAAKNPGISLYSPLSDVLKKDSNEGTFDITESYNNPNKIEFDLN